MAAVWCKGIKTKKNDGGTNYRYKTVTEIAL